MDSASPFQLDIPWIGSALADAEIDDTLVSLASSLDAFSAPCVLLPNLNRSPTVSASADEGTHA